MSLHTLREVVSRVERSPYFWTTSVYFARVLYMGLQVGGSSNELRAVATVERQARQLATVRSQAQEFCPRCGGFCGDCRQYLAMGEQIYRWGGLPFHPTCGPGGGIKARRLEAWKPKDSCPWPRCQRFRDLRANDPEWKGVKGALPDPDPEPDE